MICVRVMITGANRQYIRSEMLAPTAKAIRRRNENCTIRGRVSGTPKRVCTAIVMLFKIVVCSIVVVVVKHQHYNHSIPNEIQPKQCMIYENKIQNIRREKKNKRRKGSPTK